MRSSGCELNLLLKEKMLVFKKFNRIKNSVHIISLSCNQVPPIRYGGIELVVANLCEGLSSLGVKVVCYSPGEFSIQGVMHHKTISHPNVFLGEKKVANTEEHLQSVLLGLKKNVNFGDVIIFNSSDQFRYLKKKLGLFFRFKTAMYEIAHWDDVGLYNNIIYPSKALQSQVSKPGVVIPHGQRLMFNEENIVREEHLFFAGRITKDKGVDIALESCKKIGCKLVLAGPLNDPEFSSKIITDPYVDYLGELTYQELFDQYKRAKAMIYMTQYNEPFGLAVVEAMAAGCPVIVTGLGGTGETVLDGVTGFFCNTVEDVVNAYRKCESIKSCNCVLRAKYYSVESMSKAYLLVLCKGVLYANQRR